MKTLLCYGDSNTYGFDPRGPWGGRYHAPWCSLLAEQTGWQVVNCGENGRTIPASPWEYRELDGFLRKAAPVDCVLVMLGTNDVLLHLGADLQAIVRQMERLLAHIRQSCPAATLVLVSPPPADLPEPEAQERLAQLAGLYARLAENQGLPFLDTNEWPIPLAFDGVHFSEEGHRIFAGLLCDALQNAFL